MTLPRKRARCRDRNGRFISEQTASTKPPGQSISAVLGVTEILENILINLDPKTLLLSQRVSTSWRALITKSIRLQRALFLEPVPCGDISYIDWRLDDKDWYDSGAANLNLGEHIRGPKRDQRPTLYEQHWGKTRNDQGQYRIFVNPMLTDMFPFLTSTGIYWHETFHNLPKEAQWPEASWKRMFFTQPPVNCMAVEYDCNDEEGERDEDDAGFVDWTVMSVRKYPPESKGLTMLSLYAELVNNRSGAWIEGRSMWEQYKGAEDLERVVVMRSDSEVVRT